MTSMTESRAARAVRRSRTALRRLAQRLVAHREPRAAAASVWSRYDLRAVAGSLVSSCATLAIDKIDVEPALRPRKRHQLGETPAVRAREEVYLVGSQRPLVAEP